MKYLIPLLCVLSYIIYRHVRSIEGMSEQQFMKEYRRTKEYKLTFRKILQYVLNCNADMILIQNKFPNKSKTFYNKKADKILLNNLILKKNISPTSLKTNTYIKHAFKRYITSNKTDINKFISSLTPQTTVTKDITEFFTRDYTAYYSTIYNKPSKSNKNTESNKKSNKKSLNTYDINPIKPPPLISIYNDNTHKPHNAYKNNVLLPHIQNIKHTI